MEKAGSTSKLLVHFPPQLWLGNISKHFPFLQIHIKAFVPISQDPFVGASMVQLDGEESKKVLEYLKTQKSLLNYSIFEESAFSLIINSQTRDPLLLRSIVKNAILVSLPVKVYEGKAEFVINGNRGDINGFIESLEDKGVKVEILQIGGYSGNPVEKQLTPKQYKVYQQARTMGYYDSPRRINLTSLADELHLAKSSLSSMLQRIHKRLLGN